MKKTLTALSAVAVLALAGCTNTDYEWDADPIGNASKPKKVECFEIEAEDKYSDTEIDLGKFCKVNR